MKQTLDKFISNNTNGMILLDSPTGFGKTYNVIQIMKDFIQGKSHQDIERIFFVTNLRTNLPYEDLDKLLSDEDKKKYFVAKSYEENIFDKWKIINKSSIPDEVKSSKEFKNLDGDLEILLSLVKNENKIDNKNKAINSFHNKIATISEPAFREFLRKNYFYGKSTAEKKRFIEDNKWFKILYPICDIEKYKVVFLTTAKYFSPINTFYRLPFYIHEDDIINNSLTIIDEFDASKKYILNQIVENCLKVNVDVVKMFIDIHYTLKNLHFPSLLSKVTKYNKEKVDKGEWKPAKEILRINKKLFNSVYKELNLNLLLKSHNFETKKVFLFNDGNYVTVFNDNSKKHLYLQADRGEQFLKINANTYQLNGTSVSVMLNKINHCLWHFANAVFILANNYRFFKNSINKDTNENQYTPEEAMATIMSIFNLPDENREYLKKLISFNEVDISSDIKANIRKGFQFTEVEDSNYHDLQSLIHQFNFKTTPENLLIEIANKSKLIGVSATASLPTVIGNFDIEYLKKSLNEKYCEIQDEDKSRIKQSFDENQMLYTDEISINPILIDDVDGFTDKEKSKEILKIIYSGDILNKYLIKLENDKTDQYYFLIYCKLAYVYYLIGKNDVKSTVAFVNRLPKREDSNLDINILKEMFEDIENNNNLPHINDFYVQSDNFDNEMEEVYQKLSSGESCLVITSYQTIGSGKNIQYAISDFDKDRTIINDQERLQKDFEAIYLETPRNLTTKLSNKSEDKYKDLALYLYEQQSLYLADKLTYGHYRQNIINGFKKVFFNDWYLQAFNKNSDMCCHSAQLVIQAVGRICRCKNKNKKIFVFSDKEILSRLKRIDYILHGRLFNKEFLKLYELKQENFSKENILKLSQQSKKAYGVITKNAYTVRTSKQKVNEWIALRDFVLKNPTVGKDELPDKYSDLYYVFDNNTSGYCYRYENGYNITEFKFDTQEDMSQVSAMDCELPIMLNIPCIKQLFEKESYTQRWKRKKCVMTPSLYNQVYKGALGEVVGKEILDKELGWTLIDIEDYSKYEYFDYKIKEKNIYLDFKHWNDFIKDTPTYVKKIRNKLNKVNGEKAIIINIVKRGEHVAHTNIDEDILQIPYLIDETCNEISQDMINVIQNFIQ